MIRNIFLALLLSVTFSIHAKTNLNVMVIGYTGWINWLDTIIPEFEKSNPDYSVSVVPVYGSSEQYATKVAMVLRDDNSPDLVLVEGTSYLHSYVKAGLLYPIPELKNWKEWPNFYPTFHSEMERDGEYYAVPISAGNIFLYYNKKIFKEAGIQMPWQPKNWNDILSAARTIKKNVRGVYPFWSSITVSEEETAMATALMLIDGTNCPLYNNEKWQTTSKGILDSLKFIDTLSKEQLIPTPLLLAPQAGNAMESKYAPGQKIGIILSGGWHMPQWKEKYPETIENYGLAAMPTQNGQAPGFISYSGGWLLAISAKSKDKKICWDFLELATSKSSLLKCALISKNTSPRLDVSADKDYPDFYKTPDSYLQYARFRPASPDYPVVSSELRSTIENVATQKKSPEEAMKDLTDNLERTLGSGKIVKSAVN